MWNAAKTSFLEGFRDGWTLFLSPFVGFCSQFKVNWNRARARRKSIRD